MEKSRILVAVTAAMLALQIVFCFFSTVAVVYEYDDRTVTKESYSVFEMVENYTDTFDRVAAQSDPITKDEEASTVSFISNFWLWLFFSFGVVALVCGITINDSNGVSYIILLIGSIFMAFIPFILQWSIGEIMQIADTDNELDVVINFQGWLQILCCLPIFFIRVRSFEDEGRSKKQQPAIRETIASSAVTAPTNSAEGETAFCIHCGNKVVAGANFCAKCGKGISKN